MSFFDSAYDTMSWDQVCFRLPSDLAVNALKRRVTNLDTLKMFFDNVGQQPNSIKPLKEHINSVISGFSADDLLSVFDSNYHPTLFNWMDATNTSKFKGCDPAKLGLKLLFNITDSKDSVALNAILDKILAEQEVNQAHVRAVLRKADDDCVVSMLNKILKDARPEVRVNILCVPGLSNQETVSDLQKIIGLKALAKCSNPKPVAAVNILSINTFNSLKPAERMIALDRYLEYFPRYHKMSAFEQSVSQEEFEAILFAGCLEQNELINKIMSNYKAITIEDSPEEPADE